ncbi:hypothetical protein KSY93_12230 [Akkermansia muciniphila]|jgi:hypothetical protein|uniref:hypothetical protein n=1 Tax=Akkermansia muciniphila TaxID=239935 RepID=UPI001C37C65B|nr:hypothetical protein [Akkermansia muciniphila]MBV4201986.1 hypothetical protein [Akkermansia muciniphila]
MKASLFSIVTVLFSGFVSSCSQCYYDDYVKSYLGKSSSELLFDWGTPSKQFKTEDGYTIIQYVKYKNFTPQPTGDPLGDALGMWAAADTNYNCTTDFMIKSNKVVSYKWEGNCKNATPKSWIEANKDRIEKERANR